MVLHDGHETGADLDETDGVMEIPEILQWAVPLMMRTSQTRNYLSRRAVLPEAQICVAIICRVAAELSPTERVRMVGLPPDEPFPVLCLARVAQAASDSAAK